MSENQINRLNLDSIQPISVGGWTKWGRPYAFSVLWLIFVILFAYLAIAIDYFVSDGSKTFFESYSKFQGKGWAILGNLGFFFFAVVDYWQTHHHYQNYELQGFIIIISIISPVLTILLPFAITFILEQNGYLCIRGEEFPITWICYAMHSFYLFSLLLLRGETQKVRSIEKYIHTYKTNPYKK